MDRETLKKIKKLRAERADLEKRIEHNQFAPQEEVADTVKDYSTGFARTIVIRGYGSIKWQRLQVQYRQKAAKLERQILELENFLDSVEDPEMRQILRYRYEDGMTHEQVGEVLGYSRQAIQKKEERFWNQEQGGAK